MDLLEEYTSMIGPPMLLDRFDFRLRDYSGKEILSTIYHARRLGNDGFVLEWFSPAFQREVVETYSTGYLESMVSDNSIVIIHQGAEYGST